MAQTFFERAKLFESQAQVDLVVENYLAFSMLVWLNDFLSI